MGFSPKNIKKLLTKRHQSVSKQNKIMKKVLVVLAVSMVLFANQAIAQLPVVPLADQQTLLKSKDKQLSKNKKLVYDLIYIILVF